MAKVVQMNVTELVTFVKHIIEVYFIVISLFFFHTYD